MRGCGSPTPPAPRAAGLAASDQPATVGAGRFVTIDTVFLRRLYVLLYMDLASRRITWFAVTANPDAAWVTQQSRNLVWQLEASPIRFVIHHHDAKYSGLADAEGHGVREGDRARHDASMFWEITKSLTQQLLT